MSQEKTRRNKRIFLAWQSGLSYRDLAKRYKMDIKTIFVIVSRWKSK